MKERHRGGSRAAAHSVGRLSDEALEPVEMQHKNRLEAIPTPRDTVAHPREGGDGPVERRTNESAESPMDVLTQMPAVVVLERIAVPALALARDGTILFANTAFAEMLGYRQDALPGLAFRRIFHTVPAAVGAISAVDALANLVVQLEHCEGWTVRARMSKSALKRSDDPIALVTFENLTEQLWMDELRRDW